MLHPNSTLHDDTFRLLPLHVIFKQRLNITLTNYSWSKAKRNKHQKDEKMTIRTFSKKQGSINNILKVSTCGV